MVLSLPASLTGHRASGIQPGCPIAQWEIGNLSNFVYLAIDWSSREALWVDPQTDLSPVTEALQNHGLTLRSLFLTHSHFDHVAGVPEAIQRFPNVPIRVHPLDQHRLRSERFRGGLFVPVDDGERIPLGADSLEVLHCPGHSAGELSLFWDHPQGPFLFTGDTLFIRDCGRTDLETGDEAQMFATLQRLKRLPPTTIILPGHHYQPEVASRLSAELLTSPPLRCQTVDELRLLP